MATTCKRFPDGRTWILAGLLAVTGGTLVSQAAAVPASRFHPGSRTVAYAEPPVSRPAGKPCVVTLFANEPFDAHGNPDSMDATPHTFDFAPPARCRGAWSRVVLSADFSVSAGRQFDRTAAIWLGGVNLYFGTTYEPSPGVAQRWHVERDLTDYASLFRHAHKGQVILNNWVARTYTTSPIHGTARLLFYPAGKRRPAAAAADRVIPLSADPVGAQTALQTASDSLSRRLVFPRNVERAYLDVIAQSQASDERWYTCVDQRYLERTRDYSLEAFEACDGGSFREVEVRIDHRPAGLAPVYPWIYTGGVAPHLWLPTPGIQTLDFVPYRVDLTPFAGMLDDGHPHTVSVRVLGASHFFNVAANLLVYLDHGSKQLDGDIVRNTLARPDGVAGPTVHCTLQKGRNGHVEGGLDTDLKQAYTVVGRLHTSHGVVTSAVHYVGRFSNHQTFRRPGGKRYLQRIDQLATVHETDTRTLGGRRLERNRLDVRYPLHIDVDKTMITHGKDFTARVALRQGNEIDVQRKDAAGRVYTASLRDNLTTRDRANGRTIPDPLDRSDFAHDEQGTQQVSFTDSLGSCYRTRLESRHERLTKADGGSGCPGGVNRLSWRSRPSAPRLAPVPVAAGRSADD